jgi:tyrosyl-tRNA synthetase
MTLSEELLWRGFIQQSTFTDNKQLDEKKWTFYHGYDASADSQTVGNLAAMMADKVFIRHGHKAIILTGGATSLVGDPGGKDKERELQDEKTVKHNIEQAEKQLKKIIHEKVTVVNNLDWLKDVKLLPFLRDVGKHFGMASLVQRDFIAQRINDPNTGISFTEFSYTLLQGYDFLHLYDKYGCTLQLGGSDQWGNCLSGVELIRRSRGAEAHVITMPLVINKVTGKKFGKSEDGAVWLDESKTGALMFYQFWLNVDDASVESYLKIFTEYDKAAIDLLMAEFHENPAGRIAQRALAYKVTELVHGSKRADEVKKVTEILFADGDFLELAKDDMELLKKELPVVKALNDLPEVIVSAGLASSKIEARKFLESGAIYVNHQKAGPNNLELFVRGNNLLRRGKNRFAIVEKK